MMKPNDKAYQAAIAENKRWAEGTERKVNQIPYWKVLRQDGENGAFDVVAKFNNRKDRDEALERLRAEAMVDAAFAAQFPPSEDYAGLIERLRNKGFYRDDWLEPVGVVPIQVSKDMSDDEGVYPQFYNPDGPEAADALEAVLAEREALKVVVEIYEKKLSGIEDEIRLAVQSAIAAVRPHIEAAEREKCVKAVETVGERINVAHHERPEWEDGYLQGVYDAAAAIRSGK